jgi:dTMP kinase
MYIAFEGIDGCGKTQQIVELENYLLHKHKTVLKTQELGSKHSKECQVLRDLYLNNNFVYDRRAAQLILAANSLQHNEVVVKPLYYQYDYLLSDRCFLSNIVYSLAQGVDKDYTYQLHKSSLKTYPDYIVFLDVEPEEAFKRISQRTPESFENNGHDRLEAQGIELQKRVRGLFLSELNKWPLWKTIVIDCYKRSTKQINEEIVRRLDI